MITRVQINLAVKDLASSMDFFGKLGFSFDPEHTEEHVACLVLCETVSAMLIAEELFQTYTPKEIADATVVTEVLTTFLVESRPLVDILMEKALEAGALEVREMRNEEHLYSRCFEDPDGHIWEVVHREEKEIVENEGEYL